MHALLWTLVALMALAMWSHVSKLRMSDDRLAKKLAEENTVQRARSNASIALVLDGILIVWIAAVIRG